MDAWVGGALERKVYKPPNTKRLTFDLDAEVHSQLKIHCATQGIPVTDFLRSLIEQAISRR
jgi:predicted DNA binding CopG/RHH family protein